MALIEPRGRFVKKQLQVIIVDDDRAVRESLKFSLSLDGLAVQTCDSGLNLLRDGDLATVDCLVLDCKMPDMDGFAVVAELSARDIKVPIILITAPVTERVRQQAKRAGVFSVLEKPLLDGTLFDHVRRAALA
jgi:two-component system response regulator FixJ